MVKFDLNRFKYIYKTKWEVVIQVKVLRGGMHLL